MPTQWCWTQHPCSSLPHPRPMHGRHPHLSSPSPLSPSNRHTRLHKDSQSRSSARMESEHTCCPSLHLLAMRTMPVRRLLVSPAACSPLAAITRSDYACIRTSNQRRQHLLDGARPLPQLLSSPRRRDSPLRRAAASPLSTTPPWLPSSSRCRSSSLFTAPPRLPSSSCRQWWKTPFDVDARAERQTVKRRAVWFCPFMALGLGLDLEPRPICIDEGFMPIPLIKVAHAHFKLAHQVAQFLNNFFF